MGLECITWSVMTVRWRHEDVCCLAHVDGKIWGGSGERASQLWEKDLGRWIMKKCKWGSDGGNAIGASNQEGILFGSGGSWGVWGFSSGMRWRLERERVKSVGSSLDIPRGILPQKEQGRPREHEIVGFYDGSCPNLSRRVLNCSGQAQPSGASLEGEGRKKKPITQTQKRRKLVWV